MPLTERAFVVGPASRCGVLKRLPKEGFVPWRILRRSDATKERQLAAAAVILQPVPVTDFTDTRTPAAIGTPPSPHVVDPIDARIASVWKVRQTIIAITPMRRIAIAERIQVWDAAPPTCVDQKAPRDLMSQIEDALYITKSGDVPPQTMVAPSRWTVLHSPTRRDRVWHFDGRPRSFREFEARFDVTGEFTTDWRQWLIEHAGDSGIPRSDPARQSHYDPQHLSTILAALGTATKAWHDAIADSLDPDLLHASRNEGRTDLELYAFLKGAHWLSLRDPQVRTWRIQAAREMRTYIHQLVEPSPFALIDFPNAVDRGIPLIPLFAKEYGVTREVIRWGRRARHLSFPYDEDTFRSSLRVLGALPPEKRPVSTENWKAFEFLTAEARKCLCALEKCNLPEDRFEVATANFIREQTRYGFPEALRRWRRHCGATQGMADLPDCVRGVAAILDAQGIDEANERALDFRQPPMTSLAFWQAMLAHGIVRIQAFNEAWHRGVVEFNRVGLVRNAPEMCWPALAPDWTRDGYVIHCLSHAAEVIDEGRAMSHCVAAYVDACWMGLTHLFSLRTTPGARLSTIEVRLNQIGGRFRPELLQHRARFNAPPTALLQSLARRWFDEAVLQIPFWELDSIVTANAANRSHRISQSATRLTLRRYAYALRYAWPTELGQVGG